MPSTNSKPATIEMPPFRKEVTHSVTQGATDAEVLMEITYLLAGAIFRTHKPGTERVYIEYNGVNVVATITDVED